MRVANVFRQWIYTNKICTTILMEDHKLCMVEQGRLWSEYVEGVISRQRLINPITKTIESAFAW